MANKRNSAATAAKNETSNNQNSENATMTTENTETQTQVTEAAAAASERVIRNGVKQPLPTSKAFKIWELANKLSETAKRPVTLDELVGVGLQQGLNVNSMMGEYTLWRKFYGITGRTVDIPKLKERIEKAKAELAKLEKQLADATAGDESNPSA